MKKLTWFIMLVTLWFAGAAKATDENPAEPISDGELAKILAPIALYPDTLLSHILIASTYPIEVVKAERWTREHPDIEGRDAVEAVEDEDWDPSVKALTAFPKILEKMSEDLDWTQQLGEAFLADEERLLAMVQTLRKKAKAAGNLDKFEYLDVSEEDGAIIIEPREREIIYVPYYDTRVVYGPWYWRAYPPIHWYYPTHFHVDYYYPGRIVYWGPRVHLSYSFFFGAFHWHSHRLVVLDPYYYRHHHGYYRARSIARDARVRVWRHNPVHRRGVAYRDLRVSRRYAINRQQEVRPAVARPGANRVTTGTSVPHSQRPSNDARRYRQRADIDENPRVRQRADAVIQRLRSDQQHRPQQRVKPTPPVRQEKPRVAPTERGHQPRANPHPQPRVEHYRTPERREKPRVEREPPRRQNLSRENRTIRAENKGRSRREREREYRR